MLQPPVDKLKDSPTKGSTRFVSAPNIPIPEILVDMNLPHVREFASKLRFSPNEGKIWLDDRRMVMLNADAFSSLREELVASLGVDTARGLLTRIGYAAGCRDAEMAWKMSGGKASLVELMRTGAIFHSLQGFVLAERIARDDSHSLEGKDYYGEWIWKHSIEDEGHVAHHGIGSHAVCWTEVGYSAGHLSTCTGQRDRLIKPLASSKGVVTQATECLTGTHKMINLVYMVDVDRSNVQYSHFILYISSCFQDRK